MLQLLGSAIFIAALVFTLVSIITAENWQIKHLPKVTWVFIVIFIPLIGMALWPPVFVLLDALRLGRRS